MRLCILCEDSNVESARENVKTIFIPNTNPKPILHQGLRDYKESLPKGHLSIPLSETGELPATHWFCFLNTDEAGYARILSVQQHSIIEESSPREFLLSKGLKMIK